MSEIVITFTKALKIYLTPLVLLGLVTLALFSTGYPFFKPIAIPDIMKQFSP